MVDAANSLADVIYRLGFQNATDLDAAGTWCPSSELYQWADEAAQKIAYASGAFITVDDSIAVTPGTGVYPLPANHVFTLQAFLTGGTLRITRVRELEALDATWAVTTGTPARCSLDAGAVGTVTLYPSPTAADTLTQICGEYPPTIALGSSTVALPSPLQDYLSYAMLAGARGKESDAAMPEVAEHCEERLNLYLQIAQHLWGTGQ